MIDNIIIGLKRKNSSDHRDGHFFPFPEFGQLGNGAKVVHVISLIHRARLFHWKRYDSMRVHISLLSVGLMNSILRKNSILELWTAASSDHPIWYLREILRGRIKTSKLR